VSHHERAELGRMQAPAMTINSGITEEETGDVRSEDSTRGQSPQQNHHAIAKKGRKTPRGRGRREISEASSLLKNTTASGERVASST